uniref:Craniofacial development protein 2 n=1 Tax=Cacopsylla melanoneura TaxID=428564 RepID=A0A8D8YL68_9HEMI
MTQLKEEKSNVHVMGDFNASVGQELTVTKCIGKFRLGKLNDRGQCLIEFCEQLNLIITNTFYEVPNRRRYTWKAPGDIRRFQIDFIMVKQKYRNQIKSSHSYPGFNVDSDHNLVMAKCNTIRFKTRRNVTQKKWCLEKFKYERKQIEFKKELETKETETWEELNSSSGNIR